MGWRWRTAGDDGRSRVDGETAAKKSLPALLPAQPCAVSCPCIGIYSKCRCGKQAGNGVKA